MRKREERAVAIPLEGGEQALEGIFIAGVDDDAMGVVVAAPHPLYGGSMDSPVVNEIAYAARKAGLASLRFNWRGVGASAGVISGEADDADADYRAALQHLLETVPGAVVAAGYSFGAAAAVRVAAGEPRIRRLLLLAPPPALLDVDALAAFAGDVLLDGGRSRRHRAAGGARAHRVRAPASDLRCHPARRPLLRRRSRRYRPHHRRLARSTVSPQRTRAARRSRASGVRPFIGLGRTVGKQHRRRSANARRGARRETRRRRSSTRRRRSSRAPLRRRAA